MTPLITADIHPEDTIMIRATYCGRIIANIISDGFEDTVDVLRAVRSAVGTIAGCINLSFRNAGNGRTGESALFITPAKPGTQQHLF